MSIGKITAILSSIVVLAALSLAGYWALRKTEPDICRVCRREIHPQSRAVIEVDSKREAVCCIRCALTVAHQQSVSIRLLEVAEYTTGRPIAPATAFYVEGSRIVLCEKHEPMLLDPTKHPYGRVFDRCEPSVYAFARRDDAEAFAARHGGTLRTLAELLKGITGVTSRAPLHTSGHGESRESHDQSNH